MKHVLSATALWLLLEHVSRHRDQRDVTLAQTLLSVADPVNRTLNSELRKFEEKQIHRRRESVCVMACFSVCECHSVCVRERVRGRRCVKEGEFVCYRVFVSVIVCV